MKRIAFVLLIQLVIVGCQSTQSPDDPQKLKDVLVGYFDGISAKDFQKMKDLTTSDFLLYEDGKIFNNDSLFKMMNSFSNYKAVYKFDKMIINVDNHSGNMSYLSHMDFTLNDTTHMTFNWLESAAFKKEDGNWKMNFLHSTVRK